MGIKYQRKEFLERPVSSVALPGSVVTATTRRTRLSLVKSGSTERNPASWKAMIKVSRDCVADASCVTSSAASAASSCSVAISSLGSDCSADVARFTAVASLSM